MANRMGQSVGYQRFELDPVLENQKLPQPNFGGDLLARTADALFRLADAAGAYGERQQQKTDDAAGMADAQAMAPQASTITASNAPEVGGDVGQIIEKAARRYGLDPGTMRKIAYIESRGNPNAKNKSGASGLFQFMPGTARQYNLSNPFDPVASADAAMRLARDNANFLRRRLGREPTAGELYLAHQQGAGGAAKLLANPNAPAASLVGRAAVVQNGGRADMSAGDFARMWTGKMEGVSVEARGGGFKLTGRAAYDRHANDYWQRVTLALDQDIDQISTQFADDPARAEQALGELRQVYLDRHVMPEVSADFEEVFRSRSSALVTDLRNKAASKAEAEGKAAFAENIRASETARDRFVETLDASPEAAASLLTRQDEIDAQYDDAATRGLMTPLQASEAKAASRRGTVTRFYERQAEKLTRPEEVAALRQTYRQDWIDGKLSGLDAAGFDALDQRLQAMESKAGVNGAKADNAIATRGDELANRVANGGDVTTEELAGLEADAGTAPNGETIVGATRAKIDVARTMRDLPIDQAAAKLDEMAAKAGPGASSAVLEAINFGRGEIAKQRQKLASDPLGLAVQKGIIPDLPALDLTLADEGALTGAIAERVATARAVASHFNRPTKILRPEEADQLKGLLKTDPDQAATTLIAMMTGAGPQAPAILAEVGTAVPAFQMAGTILLNGGSSSAAVDVLRGASTAPDGKAWKTLKPEIQQSTAKDVLGSALDHEPDEARRITGAAALIARYRMADAGLTPDDPGATEIYKNALQEAAGAQFEGARQWGGIATVRRGGYWGGTDAQVMVPPQIEASRFDDVLDAIRDQDLPSRPVDSRGQPISWSMISEATPIATDGGYAFVLGSAETGDARMFLNADGTPWVLPLENLLPVIAKRTVGAVRGY